MTLAPSHVRAARLALLLLFVGQSLWCATQMSATYDEGPSVVAGLVYLEHGDHRFNPEHPPLGKLLPAMALRLSGVRLPPLDLDEAALDQWGLLRAQTDRLLAERGHAAFVVARLPSVALGALVVLVVGLWAGELFGAGAGLFAMALAAFDPTLVAHCSLATLDAPVTAFGFVCAYALWRNERAPSWAAVLVGALGLGAALATKLTALLLLPLAAAAVIASARRLERPVRGALARLAALLAGAALVLTLAYGLEPLPYANAVVAQWTHVDHGHAAWLRGEHSTAGWWFYYPLAFALKTPLVTLLALGAACLVVGRGAPTSARDTLFLLPAVLLPALIMWGHLCLGVRYLLPALPFLLVYAGRAATLVPTTGAWRAVPVALVALLAASVLRVAPWQLAYTHEAVDGRAWLADSNIDWGQGLSALWDELERRGEPAVYLGYFGTAPPEAYGLRYQGVPGSDSEAGETLTGVAPLALLAVSHNIALGLGRDPAAWAWLDARAPVAVVAGSIVLYDISADAPAHDALAQLYERAGSTERADLERALARQIRGASDR